MVVRLRSMLLQGGLGLAALSVSAGAVCLALMPKQLSAQSPLMFLRGASEPTQCNGVSTFPCDDESCGDQMDCDEEEDPNNPTYYCTPVGTCGGDIGCFAGQGSDCCLNGTTGSNCDGGS